MRLKEMLLAEGSMAAHGLNSGLTRDEYFIKRYQRLESMIAAEGVEGEVDTWKQICNLGYLWMTSGYPQITMTHKLAESLMGTIIPSDGGWEVDLPWPCFAIKVPDHLVSDEEGFIVVYREPHYAAPQGLPDDAVFSFWESCVSKEGRFTRSVVFPSLADYLTLEKMGEDYDQFDQRYNPQTLDQMDKESLLFGRLIFGACVEIDSEKPERGGGGGPSKRHGPPKAWNFKLGREVRSDVRSWVKAYMAGGGQSPTVQRLIRGHRKMQAHGPGLTLRKRLWIEPYFRGPEDAPIAVSSHHLTGDRL